jgi:Putative DNA-binding domain
MMAIAETLTPAHLTDFLTQDYPRLRLYMGETAFNTMARHYLAATETPKVRLLSRHLPDFLSSAKPFSQSPELSDLARLEKAFHAALSAPEADIITRVPLHAFHIELHPSLQRLQLRTNATSIWAALTAGELPPLAQGLNEPQELLVWRQGAAPRFRMLGREEAATLDGAARGEKIEISQLAENFLRGWLEAEIISAVQTDDIANPL